MPVMTIPACVFLLTCAFFEGMKHENYIKRAK